MATDIYSSEKQETEHSMRYISIRVNNVTGVLNRIMSLMRRKRYNMEEVSVTFDRKQKQADIILALDARMNDVNHVIQQIRKLYDVHTVTDITGEENKVLHVFDVKMKDESALKSFPRQPEKTIQRREGFYGIFMVPLREVAEFQRFLKQKKLSCGERVMGLV